MLTAVAFWVVERLGLEVITRHPELGSGRKYVGGKCSYKLPGAFKPSSASPNRRKPKIQRPNILKSAEKNDDYFRLLFGIEDEIWTVCDEESELEVKIKLFSFCHELGCGRTFRTVKIKQF